MPRKSPGHDSRVITYRTLPGSSPQYQRVVVGECTAWVQTNLAFDLEVRGPDDTTETKPYTVDTFREHHGAVEPTLYLTPSGRWVRRVSCQELPSLKPKPPLYIEVTQPFATKWLWANGYPVPGGAARSRPTPGFAIGEPLRPSKCMLTVFGTRATCPKRKSRGRSSGSFARRSSNPR